MQFRGSQRRRRSATFVRGAAFASSCRSSRLGFTLLEMTLVLAVIVIAVGISWPAVQRAFESQQLRQAAELVQVRMMAARVHALDTGLLYQFRYEPGGGRFIAVPLEQDPVNSGSVAEGTHIPKISGMLPESVQFVLDVQSQLNMSHVAMADLEGLPDAESFQGVGWGPPVIFRADGTASGGEVHLVDKQKRTLRLVIRPLTGGVAIAAEEPALPGGS